MLRPILCQGKIGYRYELEDTLSAKCQLKHSEQHKLLTNICMVLKGHGQNNTNNKFREEREIWYEGECIPL